VRQVVDNYSLFQATSRTAATRLPVAFHPENDELIQDFSGALQAVWQCLPRGT
jgi:dihydroorotase-like cyclic amidohydrolase